MARAYAAYCAAVSLRGRITLLAGLIIATFIVLGVVLTVESRRTIAGNELLGALLEPVAQRADLVTFAQVNAASALEAHQVSGDTRAKEVFERNYNEAETRLTELTTLTESDPALNSLVRRARATQQAWRDAALSSSQGSVASDALTSMLSDSITLEQTLDQRRTALSERESRLLRILTTSLVVSGVIVIVFIVLTLWGMNALVLRPLRRLRSEVQAATDRVTHPITVSGPPEFRDVMHDAESMRRALVQNIDEARHAREGLAQQAPLAAALAQFTPPDREVRIGSVAAYGVTHSAEGVVTGDWWDVFPVGSDGVGFMLGDVSGHGDRAALLATRMRAILRTALSLGRDPAQACAQAHLAIDVPNQFATAVVGVITPESVTFANAGHPDVIVMTSHGMRAEGSTGPLICSLNAQWTSRTMPLRPSDTLLMFTDGLIERVDRHGDDLSSADLLAILTRAPRAQTAREQAEWLLAQIRSDAPSWGRDDVTILCVQQLPSPYGVAR